MPHVTMVARDGALRAALNDGVQEVEPLDGGQPFETVALTSNGTNVVAYWCGWELTTARLNAIRTRLRNKGLTVPEAAAVTAAEKATFVPDPAARFYAFIGWEPDEVLTVLGVARFPAPDPHP